jgi:hypothetical protein
MQKTHNVSHFSQSTGKRSNPADLTHRHKIWEAAKQLPDCHPMATSILPDHTALLTPLRLASDLQKITQGFS